MNSYSESIKNLIDEFNKLPGIGPKTAERLVFYLLNQPKSELDKFGQALQHLKDKVLTCSQCQNFSETDPCRICGNSKRSLGVICVVATPQDLLAIEKIGDYQGVYHVLGGTIDPLEGITPDRLKIKELLARISKDNVKEIILALNPDLPGETTMLYLAKVIKQFRGVKITRLARGLPIGSNIEYADEITLSSALKGRKEV